MSMIRPMYGRGLGKRINPRNPTPDLFGGVAEEEKKAQFVRRCEEIVSFLNDERSDPAMTHHELTYGERSGGNDRDCNVGAAATGLRLP